MINFVNNGTDEAILKSLSTEECSEDLIKAMNKQGLVQKDVTVQGKNGKTFTRKQWVKASDVKGSGSQSSPHQSTSTKVVGRFKPSDFQFRAGGQQVVDFVNSLDTEFGVEKLVNGSVGFGTLTLKDGDKVGFGYDDKGAYAVWNGQRFRSASDLAKNWGKTSKSSDKKTLDTAHFESIKSDKAKALEYLKNCGVQWTENSHAGINWMRAMAAYKAATGGQKSTQKASSTPTTSQPTTQTAQVAQNPQGNSGIKMSKEDAKKKTQSFTSKVGKTDAERKAFMDKVKAQGITWKDKADDGSDVAIGVSWMRCCMAMNKHFAEGGSFDDSSSKSGKLGTKQDRENFLTGLIRSSVEDEITKTLKSIADGFDPNIDSGSWIQPDHVLNINLDSAVMQSQQYDLGVKSGNAFKKLISDKLKEMGFEVNKMGKRKSADGVSFWFDLSSGN